MGRAFEKRKYTIFAQNDRIAKQFSKIGRDIAIACKGGSTNPEVNPSLRRVLQNARSLNMPKDRIDAAIKKASGVGAVSYDIVVYEGYGPHGIPLIIEAATDNVTRTVANVRMYLRKNDGNLGATGSVAFLFERHGVFRLKPDGIDTDALELELIDHGLIALEHGESEKGAPELVLSCAFTDFGDMQSAIESRKLAQISSESEYVPITPVEVSDEHADDVLALVAALESDDDVQNVYTNLA